MTQVIPEIKIRGQNSIQSDTWAIDLSYYWQQKLFYEKQSYDFFLSLIQRNFLNYLTRLLFLLFSNIFLDLPY